MAFDAKYPVEITNLELVHQGKTRDTFKTKRDDQLAIWASNRLSTHDVVHESLIGLKGEVLTALTVFWLKHILEPQGIDHHLIGFGSGVYDCLQGRPKDYPRDFHLRTLIVQKKDPIPYEFVRRNCLDGSLYSKFHCKGLPNPYGVVIPPGMQRMETFPGGSIFTPTTKSPTGDVECNADVVRELYPSTEELSARIVAIATDYLKRREITLIDSKFEFDGDTLIDEVLTPDSSRFTRTADIVIGKAPVSMDKQIARDEAVRLCKGGSITPLKFDSEIEHRLAVTYLQCFGAITNMSLSHFQGTYME